MIHTNEQQFLIHCLQKALQVRTSLSIPADIDWTKFLQLAQRHRVIPLVHDSLKSLPDTPAEPLHTLKQEALRQQMNMLQLTGTLIRMVKDWEAAGIRAIVLKGIPLAVELYGNVALRPARDIDILIDPLQYELVESWLLANGYQEKSGFSQMSSRFKRFLIRYNRSHYHSQFIHQTTGTMIEVHWRLQKKHDHRRSFVELLKRSRTIVVSGFQLPMLGIEDEFDYLLSHGSRHMYLRLRWLMDVILCARRYPQLLSGNRQTPADEAYQSVLAQALLLTEQIFACELLTAASGHSSIQISASRRVRLLTTIAAHFIFAEQEQTDPPFGTPMHRKFVRYHWMLDSALYSRARLLTKHINTYNGWRLKRKMMQFISRRR